MRVALTVGTALMLATSSFSDLAAQALDEPSPQPVTESTGADLSLGMGVGTRDFGGQLAAGFHTSAGDFIARWAGTFEFTLFSPPESAADIAILYGRRSRGSRGWVRAAVGPSYVEAVRVGEVIECALIFCDRERMRSHTLGFAVQGDAVWAIARAFGLGASFFGNVNSEMSFAGVTIGVFLGILR